MNSPSIKLLPTHLANQIAAGEVVQRPSSAVKELVENSIDAGATHVTVVVKQSGKQLIHVIDNGKGMVKADIELSVQRHATSKIVSQSDLNAITTLGFRGEALASIAAIADLEIISKHESSDVGYKLSCSPNHMPTCEPQACDGGTQVLVRNLFYNVPARRKFLKSDLTEFRHISEVMQAIALSRPDVRFTFYDADSLIFDVRQSELKKRVLDILNVNGGRELVEVGGSSDGVSVDGFVGLPSVARQSRSGQFIFLNGRHVHSRSLSHAVFSAFEHLLDAGQHPIFVLHLKIEPEKVDVNVHPQKHEVKFEDERGVYLVVQDCVTSALAKANVIPSFLTSLPASPQPLSSLPKSASGSQSFVNRVTGEIHTAMPQQTDVSTSFQQHRSGSQKTFVSPKQIDALFNEEVEDQPVLQAGGQYILSSSADGVVVVDQRAAHERVLYEKTLANQIADAKSEQALLFSVSIQMSPSGLALVKEYASELVSLGFRIEITPPVGIEMFAVPSDVQAGNEAATLAAILDELEGNTKLPKERRQEKIAAAFAAKQSIRKGEKMSQYEMKTLVADLFRCNVPHLTPHGQPTYIVVSFDELVQRFR